MHVPPTNVRIFDDESDEKSNRVSSAEILFGNVSVLHLRVPVGDFTSRVGALLDYILATVWEAAVEADVSCSPLDNAVAIGLAHFELRQLNWLNRIIVCRWRDPPGFIVDQRIPRVRSDIPRRAIELPANVFVQYRRRCFLA